MIVKQRLLLMTALLLINISPLSADSTLLSTQLNTLIKQNSQNKHTVLRPDLAKQLKAYQQNTDALLSNKTSSKDKTKDKTSNPTVIIDAIAQHDTASLLADLVKHAMQPLGVNGRIISGQIPVSALAAAPHIAGVVALLLQAKPTLQPIDIKTLLQQSAVDIVQIDNEAKTPLAQGFDLDSGYGLVDAQQALALAQDYQASDETSEPAAFNPVVVNDASAVNGGSALDGAVFWWLLVLLVVRRYYIT